MSVRAAVAVLLLFVAAVKAEEGGVRFWRSRFTLTCPGNGTWSKGQNDDQISTDSSYEYEAEYDNKKKGLYYCTYNGERYYFYVQGKACENCFELDGSLFAVVIGLDVVGTAALMLLVFKCTKKKISAGASFTPKAPARPGGRGPPVPSPDYEQLNINTRSQDTYSMVNRTG